MGLSGSLSRPWPRPTRTLAHWMGLRSGSSFFELGRASPAFRVGHADVNRNSISHAREFHWGEFLSKNRYVWHYSCAGILEGAFITAPVSACSRSRRQVATSLPGTGPTIRPRYHPGLTTLHHRESEPALTIGAASL